MYSAYEVHLYVFQPSHLLEKGDRKIIICQVNTHTHTFSTHDSEQDTCLIA